MNCRIHPKILVLLIILYVFGFAEKQVSSQDRWWKEKRYRTEAKRIKFYQCKKVFEDISDAITYRNVNYISTHYGSEIYLNFLDIEKGYYSPDQARYIIENFLYNNPVYSFKWKLSNRSEKYAFALGSYKFKNNGYINTYKVSTSLKYINGKWLIDQIIVN